MFDLETWCKLMARQEQAESGGPRSPAPAEAGGQEPLFTYAGRIALSMSARGALDLWQEARNATQMMARQPSPGEPRPSIRELSISIARRMLLMAIDESELPSWASEQLLHRILRQDAQKRILLDLSGEPIRRLKSTVLSDALELSNEESGDEDVVLRSELHLRHFRDVLLELRDLETPGRTVLMPPLVSGWFMLLHDLLMLTEERRVLTRRVVPLDVTPELVVTRHEALLRNVRRSESLMRPMLVDLNFLWLLPIWDTFTDSLIFTMQWKAFLHRIKGLLGDGNILTRAGGVLPGEKHEAKVRLFRFIQAAWIDNVCAVSGERRGQWDWQMLSRVYEPPGGVLGEEPLEAYERWVAKQVWELYKATGKDCIRYGRLRIARDWLEFFLPMMLRPELMPDGVSSGLKPLLESTEPPGEPALKKSWERHARLLRVREDNMLREAVEGSDAFRLMVETYGQSPRHRGDWLEGACQCWVEATRPKAP